MRARDVPRASPPLALGSWVGGRKGYKSDPQTVAAKLHQPPELQVMALAAQQPRAGCGPGWSGGLVAPRGQCQAVEPGGFQQTAEAGPQCWAGWDGAGSRGR